MGWHLNLFFSIEYTTIWKNIISLKLMPCQINVYSFTNIKVHKPNFNIMLLLVVLLLLCLCFVLSSSCWWWWFSPFNLHSISGLFLFHFASYSTLGCQHVYRTKPKICHFFLLPLFFFTFRLCSICGFPVGFLKSFLRSANNFSVKFVKATSFNNCLCSYCAQSSCLLVVLSIESCLFRLSLKHLKLFSYLSWFYRATFFCYF